jgi:thiol:disulfide interchange protein DsbD
MSLFFPLVAWGEEEAEENPLLHSQLTLEPHELQAQHIGKLKLKLEIKSGYTIYADSLRLEWTPPLKAQGFSLGQVRPSPITEFFDKPTKKTKKGLRGLSEIEAVFEAPSVDSLKAQAPSELEVLLTYQSCTDSYCLFPQTVSLKSPVKWVGLTAATKQDSEMAPNKQDSRVESQLLSWDWLDRQKSQQLLASSSLILVVFAMFFLGIVTSFTPCVYPLIPITLNILGRGHGNRLQTFARAYTYVLGMAITYAVLGVIAAGSGSLFGSVGNSPWVLRGVSLVFLAMALSSFGLFEVTMPAAWQTKIQGLTPGASGYLTSFLMGNLSGLIAGPCVGPVLVGLLTYVAQTKNLWLGFWSLFAFALGMGQLLLVVGISGSFLKHLPRSGAWMKASNIVLGLFMLGAFFYYWKMAVSERLWLGSLGLGVLLGGSILAFAEGLGNDKSSSVPTSETPYTRSTAHIIVTAIRRGLGFSGLFIGSFLIIWAAADGSRMIEGITRVNPGSSTTSWSEAWLPYSEQELQKAMQAHTPVLIDFYADWCTSCAVMEKEVFSQARFLEAARGIKLMRFDATVETSELKQLKQRFNIVGLPTVVVFDKTGTQREDLEVVGEASLAEFLDLIEKLKSGH